MDNMIFTSEVCGVVLIAPFDKISRPPCSTIRFIVFLSLFFRCFYPFFLYHRTFLLTVPFEKIIPNTYNPNSVAPPEMKLLYLSILEDGYTQPIVCYYSAKQDLYAIVDGFHRWRVMKEHRDIYEREQGMLPVAVIDKPLSNRMASTIRHNRARGSHNVDLMSNIIKELHELGRSDAWIAKHLGMDKDEVLRLKQITGLAALFRDVKFGQAWRPVEEDE